MTEANWKNWHKLSNNCWIYSSWNSESAGRTFRLPYQPFLFPLNGQLHIQFINFNRFFKRCPFFLT